MSEINQEKIDAINELYSIYRLDPSAFDEEQGNAIKEAYSLIGDTTGFKPLPSVRDTFKTPQIEPTIQDSVVREDTKPEIIKKKEIKPKIISQEEIKPEDKVKPVKEYRARADYPEGFFDSRENVSDLGSFIHHYAPETENPTKAYIDSISSQLGITPDTPFHRIKPEDLVPLIAKQEGYGRPNVPATRNNNPGNLEFAGQPLAIGKDNQGFAIFESPQDGVEALINQIKLDQSRSKKWYKKETDMGLQNYWDDLYQKYYDQLNQGKDADEMALLGSGLYGGSLVSNALDNKVLLAKEDTIKPLVVGDKNVAIVKVRPDGSVFEPSHTPGIDHLNYVPVIGDARSKIKYSDKRRELEEEGYRILNLDTQQIEPTLSDLEDIQHGAVSADKKGFMDVMRDAWEDPAKYAPITGSYYEGEELWKIFTAAKKLENANGDMKALSDNEIELLYDFVLDNETERDFGGKVAEVLVNMPSFWGEILVTGGALTAGKWVTKKIITKGLKEGLEKQIKDRLIVRGVKKTAEVALVTIAGSNIAISPKADGSIGFAGRVDNTVIKKIIPGLETATLGNANLLTITGPGMDKDKAEAQAKFETYLEFFSEQTGPAFKWAGRGLGKPISKLFNQIGKLPGGDAIKRTLTNNALINTLRKANPNASVPDLKKIAERLGYHGILEEMMEERVVDISQQIALTASDLGIVSDDFDNPNYEWNLTIEQLLVELTAFSAPTGAIKSGQYLLNFSSEQRWKNSTIGKKIAEAREIGVPEEELEGKSEEDKEKIRARHEQALFMLEFFAKRNPEMYDKHFIVDIIPQLNEITKEQLEEMGLSMEGEGLDADTPVARILGSTEYKTFEKNAKVLISLYQGAGADTTVEEWYGANYKSLSEEEKNNFQQYYEKYITDSSFRAEVNERISKVEGEHFNKNSVLKPQELFEKDGKAHFFEGGVLYENSYVGKIYRKLKDMFDRLFTIGTVDKSVEKIYRDVGVGEKIVETKDIEAKEVEEIPVVEEGTPLEEIDKWITLGGQELVWDEESRSYIPKVEEDKPKREPITVGEQDMVWDEETQSYIPKEEEDKKEVTVTGVKPDIRDGKLIRTVAEEYTIKEGDAVFIGESFNVAHRVVKVEEDGITVMSGKRRNPYKQTLTLDNLFTPKEIYEKEAGIDPVNVIEVEGDKKLQKEYEEKLKKSTEVDKDKPSFQLAPKKIADLFTEDQTDNTGKLAEDKVELSRITDTRLPGGTTRNVYNINGKVLKIAKNPRGLEQNSSLKYGDLDILGSSVPNIYEIGLDYIVTENVPRKDKETRKFLKPLQKFNQTDFDNKTADLQDVLLELGLEDFMNYEVLWNDFKAFRNWGQRKNGDFVLIDEGALNKNITSTSKIPDWAKEEWNEIKSKRKKIRKLTPKGKPSFQLTPKKSVLDVAKELGAGKTEPKNEDKVSVAVVKGIRDVVKSLEDENIDLHATLEWYFDSMDKAQDIAMNEVPIESPTDALLFRTILALQSQGAKPEIQYNTTIGSYGYYKDNGTFNYNPSTTTGKEVLWSTNIKDKDVMVGGLESGAVYKNHKKLEALIEKFGLEKAMEFIITKHTGRELLDLMKELGMPKPNVRVGDEYYGARVFGPKIGAFTMNLNGVSDIATYDRWWVRTWNRWMGTPTKIEKGEEKVKGTPTGLPEEDLMNEAIAEIAKELTEATGYNWTPPAVQAVLWYYEKDLYIKHGASVPEGEDYLGSAKIRAKEKGYATTPRGDKAVRGIKRRRSVTKRKDIASLKKAPSKIRKRAKEKAPQVSYQLTPAQKEFFKDTKAVDKNGEPLRVYHGSSTKPFDSFAFGGWFTSNPSYASAYAQVIASGENVAYTGLTFPTHARTIPSYINIKKPLELNFLESNEQLIDYSTYIDELGAIVDKQIPENIIDLFRDTGESGDISGKVYAYEMTDILTMGEGEKWIKSLGYDGIKVKEAYLSDPNIRDTELEYVDTYFVFKPEQVKSVYNVNPKEDPKKSFQLAPKPKMFSTAETVADKIEAKSMKAQSIIPYLRKNGVKQDEIDWLLIGDWLSETFKPNEKVPTEKLKEYIRQHKVVFKAGALDEGLVIVQGEEFIIDNPRQKFSHITIVGGEDSDYREVVITLPKKEGTPYTSEAHFGNVKNPVAHFRVTTRYNTQGEKVLYIEEVQSDWNSTAFKIRESRVRELAIELIENKTINPETNKPFTMENWAEVKKIVSKKVPDDYGYLPRAIDKAKSELKRKFVFHNSTISQLVENIFTLEGLENNKILEGLSPEIKKAVGPALYFPLSGISVWKEKMIFENEQDYEVQYRVFRSRIVDSIIGIQTSSLLPIESAEAEKIVDSFLSIPFNTTEKYKLLKEGKVPMPVDMVEYLLNNLEDATMGDVLRFIIGEVVNERKIREESNRVSALYDSNAKPDNPYKETKKGKPWVNLAIKRIIMYGVENGFDRIAWSDGAFQNKINNIARGASSIEYKRIKGTNQYEIKVYDLNGNRIIDHQNLPNIMTLDKMDSYFNSSIIDRIIKGEGKKVELPDLEKMDKEGLLDVIDSSEGGWTRLEDGNLDSSPVFHMNLYERFLPNGFKKIGKGLGVGVETTTLEISGELGDRMPDDADYIDPTLDSRWMSKKEVNDLKLDKDEIKGFHRFREVDLGFDHLVYVVAENKETGKFSVWRIEEDIEQVDLISSNVSWKHMVKSLIGEEVDARIDRESIPLPKELKSKVINEGLPSFQLSPKSKPLDVYKDINPKNIKTASEGDKDFNQREHKVIPVSTILERISPVIHSKLLRLQFNVGVKQNNARDRINDFRKKVNKMSKKDQAIFKLAMLNSDYDTMIPLVNKYEMHTEFAEARLVLEEIRNGLISVGEDVGYIENYFPRKILNLQGLRQSLNQDAPTKTFIDSQIEQREQDLDRRLTSEEEIDLINKLIRGYSYIKSKPSFLKGRKLEQITADQMEFYEDPIAQLGRHIDISIERIENKKFLGHSDASEESIGAYIQRLRDSGMEISDAEEHRIFRVLSAYFNHQPIGGMIGNIKTLAYGILLSRFTNAVTQVQDQVYSVYENGWNQVRTIKNILRYLFRMKRIKRTDIGVEKIAQELDFSLEGKGWQGRLTKLINGGINLVFTFSGFTAMDGMGKSNIINSAIQRYRAKAKKNRLSKKDKDYLKNLVGEEYDQLIEDLKLAGDSPTMLELFLAYARLAHYQPIGRTEVPLAYLESGAIGRMFYMLKTFGIKQLNVLRDEGWDIISGKQKGNKIKATANLMYLGTLIVLAGAGGDELKEWMKGKKSRFSEKIEDNLLKIILVNKYFADKTRREAVYKGVITSFIENFQKNFLQLTAPTVLAEVLDALMKEVYKEEDAKPNKGTRYIPLIGDLLYTRRDLSEAVGIGGRGRDSYVRYRLNDYYKATYNKDTKKPIQGVLLDWEIDEYIELIEDAKKYSVPQVSWKKHKKHVRRLKKSKRQ